MTKEMFDWITKWQRETFTKATNLSAAYHLKVEVRELIEDIERHAHGNDIKSEYADCFLLLFGSAALFGMSFDDICNAINKKMEVNMQRKWRSDNEEGYVKHVESGEAGKQISNPTDGNKIK